MYAGNIRFLIIISLILGSAITIFILCNRNLVNGYEEMLKNLKKKEGENK